MELVQLGRKAREEAKKENGCPTDDVSPFNPPDPYAPPGQDLSVPTEELHPVLRAFRLEHEAFIKQLDTVEQVLNHVLERGPSNAADEALGVFFQCVENEVLPHNRREEEVLFPLMALRLKEAGEHSQTPEAVTGIDVLRADHLHVVQLSAVMLNFFGIAGRLPDRASQRMVIEAGIRQGKALVELLRLHMFREDEVLFSLAHKLLTAEDLAHLEAELG
ncbi:MAG: hemerythrin domain-containing protein [Proteobacteria bacterium]|nr:hemerythrin domain-containing protein [Pseudomonadota bacterium]